MIERDLIRGSADFLHRRLGTRIRPSIFTPWKYDNSMARVSGFQANCGLWVSLPEGPFIVCVWPERLDAIQESRRETIPSIDPKESPAHHSCR